MVRVLILLAAGQRKVLGRKRVPQHVQHLPAVQSLGLSTSSVTSRELLRAPAQKDNAALTIGGTIATHTERIRHISGPNDSTSV